MRKFYAAVFTAVMAFAIAGAASAEVIEVTNGVELFAALRNVSSGTIRLAPGNYDITSPPDEVKEEVGFAFYGNAYYLSEADGLEIIGAGSGKTNVVLSMPEVTVLWVRDCKNLKISGITFGHVPTGNEDNCAGNVLELYDCERVTLEDVDIFGCGVTGLTLYGCKDVSVTDSIIRDCTDRLATVGDCSGVRFANTRFRHRDDAFSKALSLWSENGSVTTFDGCDFAVPQGKFVRYGEENSDAKHAAFIGATFYGGPREDDIASLASDDPSLSFKDTIFKGADEPGIVDHFGGPDPNDGM